jgi:hypothetical protein
MTVDLQQPGTGLRLEPVESSPLSKVICNALLFLPLRFSVPSDIFVFATKFLHVPHSCYTYCQSHLSSCDNLSNISQRFPRHVLVYPPTHCFLPTNSFTSASCCQLPSVYFLHPELQIKLRARVKRNVKLVSCSTIFRLFHRRQTVKYSVPCI